MCNMSKCCFCIPLKSGLIYGTHAKLMLLTLYSIYWLSVNPVELNNLEKSRNDGSLFPVLVIGTGIFFEMIFSLVLLAGIHKNIYRIVRVTYIYNVILMGIEILLLAVYIPLEIYRQYVTVPDDFWWPLFTSMTAALLAVVLQLYMVALIRNYLRNMREQCVSDPESSTYCLRKPYVVY